MCKTYKCICTVVRFLHAKNHMEAKETATPLMQLSSLRQWCPTRDPTPYVVYHIQIKSVNLFLYLNLNLVVIRVVQTFGLAGGNTICKEQPYVPKPFGSGAGDYQRRKKRKTKKSSKHSLPLYVTKQFKWKVKNFKLNQNMEWGK